MKESGINLDIFAPHSTRAAATSAVLDIKYLLTLLFEQPGGNQTVVLGNITIDQSLMTVYLVQLFWIWLIEESFRFAELSGCGCTYLLWYSC